MPARELSEPEIAILENIQKRVLWLSTYMLHYCNRIRPNPDGSKVGGHQASSASTVTLTTALLFHMLRHDDRFQFKPHGSPAYHSALYLMGALPRRYLTTLREFGGLQSYLSRTKDVDVVDFSNGSMGLGCAAPVFAATAQKYAEMHFGDTTARRFVTVSGDAELDEGNVWETLLEEGLRGVNNVMWIVDLNRQSLDRVVPGVRAARLKSIFAACGWEVVEAKYGTALQAAFERPGGHSLRKWIDDMANEQYQSLIRSDAATIRAAAMATEDDELIAFLGDVPDADLPSLLGNLGGNDMRELLSVLRAAEAVIERNQKPVVVFAYTIKGYGLPLAGDPFNHAALLSDELIDQVRRQHGVDEADLWPKFPAGSPEAAWCEQARARLGLNRFDDDAFTAPAGYGQFGRAGQLRAVPLRPDDVPFELNATQTPLTSTQDAFGRAMARLADLPVLAKRVVTTSADVATSTNLGGWINRAGLFAFETSPDYEAGRPRPINWRGGPNGQHIELGIAEMNLYMLLGQLGLSHELSGQLLLPIGTLYDPFVARGLDALIYGLYSGSRFIFAATPSGTTLSPEGGAHQSSVTASLGLELPNLDYYEPCFALEVEWALLEGLRQCLDRAEGRSTYIRMTTKPVKQALMQPALERLGVDGLRRKALAGGYRLRVPDIGPGAPLVHVVTCGAMVPEAVEAAEYLESEGVAANVINLTSPRKAYDGWKASLKDGRPHVMEEVILAGQRNAPIVTVHDAASHALAWVGSVFGQRVTALGVDKFGQCGTRQDVYRYVGIGADAIVAAAFAAVDPA